MINLFGKKGKKNKYIRILDPPFWHSIWIFSIVNLSVHVPIESSYAELINVYTFFDIFHWCSITIFDWLFQNNFDSIVAHLKRTIIFQVFCQTNFCLSEIVEVIGFEWKFKTVLTPWCTKQVDHRGQTRRSMPCPSDLCNCSSKKLCTVGH